MNLNQKSSSRAKLKSISLQSRINGNWNLRTIFSPHSHLFSFHPRWKFKAYLKSTHICREMEYQHYPHIFEFNWIPKWFKIPFMWVSSIDAIAIAVVSLYHYTTVDFVTYFSLILSEYSFFRMVFSIQHPLIWSIRSIAGFFPNVYFAHSIDHFKECNKFWITFEFVRFSSASLFK